jgi:rhodanese-related sulfurtransferase
MIMSTITCIELQDIIAASTIVIDVMTPEDYAVCHVAGAKNACIYEMVFLDRIDECAPDRETRIVVYDTSGTTRTAAAARERLVQAGYTNVSILKGGLSAWRSEGLPVETGEQIKSAEPSFQDGAYRIDVEKSVAEWIGRNLNNRHNGRIAILEGGLAIKNSGLSEAHISLDMNTITNLDVQDTTWRAMLISHLKSEDFFATERFPTATFRLTGWVTQENSSPELMHGIATGDLTIRDVSRSISFPATVAPQADGGIKAHAAFEIDRTLWNVCYGSGKLFERLGMHLVDDIVTLELFIQAR